MLDKDRGVPGLRRLHNLTKIPRKIDFLFKKIKSSWPR